MINKRLIGTVGESKKYIAGNVAALRHVIETRKAKRKLEETA